jgi:citronellol/citronellal dehydrogenase
MEADSSPLRPDANAGRVRRAVPLGRLGRPEEVPGPTAFLASAGGADITGTTVVVDGGADAWGLAEPPPAPATKPR